MATRRTTAVLLSLLGALTATAGLLLALEPAPVVPAKGAIQLTALKQHVQPRRVLFATERETDRERWQAVVVRFSGRERGSAERVARRHRREGRQSLGYHLVIGNGRGAPDGEIQIGRRWQLQIAGAHSDPEHADWYNEHAVGICLIGKPGERGPTDAQLRALLWVLHRLQDRLEIPADRIVLNAGEHGPGGGMPIAWIRQQLKGQPAS
jgi:hypothetical protein